MARLTGLDRIGIPVVMVVRPASRNLSVMQGKGLTDDSAVASGLMEALESFCSERIGGKTEHVTLPSASRDPAFAVPDLMLHRVPPQEEPIPWTQVADMFGGPARWLPSELVYADFSSPPPPGQGHFVTTTNGLAAGNSRHEALLHGLCEVIERDAIALWMTGNRQGRAGAPLDTRTLAGPGCLHLLELLEATNLRFDIWDVTSDIGIPCFLCVLDDQHDGGNVSLGRIAGAGCHPDADIALCRAMTEAAQARLTIISGVREDVEADLYRMMECNHVLAKVFSTPRACQPVPFEDRSMSGDTIAGDLQVVLRRLEASGLDTVLSADLPCPIDGLSCVRVLAPQLEGVFEKPWYQPGRRARALLASPP